MRKLPKLQTIILLAVLLIAGGNNPHAHKGTDQHGIGPVRGTLLAVGGEAEALFRRFIRLAGGPTARIVFIPTALAEGSPQLKNLDGFADYLRYSMGLPNLTVLHTRDRTLADSVPFVRPIQPAAGVWFSGGRQWRLADAYLGTRTHKALKRLLARGGIIGGSSAGATIQGSFLVRGDTRTNTIMVGDHQVGLGFLRNVAIDQHVFELGRELDLLKVVKAHPEILGIGLDEKTGMIVRGDVMVFVGARYVYIYDSSRWKPDMRDTKKLFHLEAGDRYDLRKRRRIP